MLLALVFLVILAITGMMSAVLGVPLIFIIALGVVVGLYFALYGGMGVLMLRGWRRPADLEQYNLGFDKSPWTVALKPKAAVERFFASSALMGHRPVSDEVYAWYGDDALEAHRAANQVKWRYGHYPEEVLTAIAEAGIRDYKSVMVHLDNLDIPSAIIMATAIREGIPYEYAKAMRP